MNNPRAQERVKEARKRVDNLIAQAREHGTNNLYEDMTALDLQRAVHQARNRPVPAPRPPPDQITRTQRSIVAVQRSIVAERDEQYANVIERHTKLEVKFKNAAENQREKTTVGRREKFCYSA